MDYKKHIEIAINYIEENLQNNINIADCAKTCGYSVYHFLRIFKQIKMNISPRLLFAMGLIPKKIL